MFRPYLLVIVFLISAPAFSFEKPKLCTAMRVNGHLLSSHWGALARIIEQFGHIDVLSGGSSATISSFLYESIQLNSQLSCKNHFKECMEKRNEEVSFLLKSLVGFSNIFFLSDEYKALMELKKIAPKLKAWKDQVTRGRLKELPVKEVTNLVRNLLKLKYISKMINRELYEFLKEPFKKDSRSIDSGSLFLFRLKELIDSIVKLAEGGFDAKNDKTMFFRPGLTDFKTLATYSGYVANFYAGYDFTQKEKTDFKSYLQYCSRESKGKTWSEIINEKPLCKSELEIKSKAYLKSLIKALLKKEKRRMRVNENIGIYNSALKKVGAIPTVSVLSRSATRLFKSLRVQYLNNQLENKELIVGEENISFGYWGSWEHLKYIKANLNPLDEKSKRFRALGPTDWKQVLRLSPAEPTLARVQLIRNSQLSSIGGWSDPHPTLILKAMGCRKIIFVTRKGGDSFFGQGGYKRLSGSPLDWSYIDPKAGDESKRKNNVGNKDDMTSTWSKLYNLANPNSSVNKSLRTSDAVWCTNWDDIKLDLNNPLKTIENLFNDAYEKPSLYFPKKSSIKNRSSFTSTYEVFENDQYINNKGWPEYAGCIPYEYIE